MESKIHWTLGQIAKMVGGSVDGEDGTLILRPVDCSVSDPGGLAFAETEEYLARAESAGVGAVILPHNLRSTAMPSIRTDHPRMAFGAFLAAIERRLPLPSGIHPQAVVSPDAEIDPSAKIGPFAVVEAGVSVGPEAEIFPFAYVGPGCSLGRAARVLPHAVLLQDVCVGDHAVIHPGAVVGSAGFGYVWDGTMQRRVPQVGSVDVASNAEVGSNTTVDRAMLGTTKIGMGAKIDNLVQIGHNCEIGENSVLAGMCGLSGSTIVGDRVVMGGGVGTRDHVTIASDVILGGRSGVDGDITEPGEYFGTPARPAAEAKRNFLMLPRLYEMYRKLRELEKKVGSS